MNREAIYGLLHFSDEEFYCFSTFISFLKMFYPWKDSEFKSYLNHRLWESEDLYFLLGRGHKTQTHTHTYTQTNFFMCLFFFFAMEIELFYRGYKVSL